MGRIEEYNIRAMVSYARRNLAMLTSVGAMVVTLLLIIFFGAWAVSASTEAGLGSVLTTATSGFTSGYGQTASTSGPVDPNAVPRLATAAIPGGGGAGATASDTWWGKAFLTACPLH